MIIFPTTKKHEQNVAKRSWVDQHVFFLYNSSQFTISSVCLFLHGAIPFPKENANDEQHFRTGLGMDLFADNFQGLITSPLQKDLFTKDYSLEV